MATVHCSKCTAERKGLRRELDSWRHKLIHCIGFESILEGIYGPLLLKDLNLFDDCEPEEVIDWFPEESRSQCSFCNLSLDKHNDEVLSTTSPLSSPSDYSPRHVPMLSESSQSAHRFLQAVFHKRDVPQDCDPNIPLIAQELMKKMIRQFAMEYASKCLLHTTSKDVPRKTTSPASETADAPLDLTMSRPQEEKEPQPDGVLDLSNRKSASLPTSKPSVSSINHKGSGCCQSTIAQEPRETERQGTKNSALGAVLNSLCPAHQSLVYRILKLAHQQKLLFFKPLNQVKPECFCCHCGKHVDSHIHHYHGAMSDCTACGYCHHWLIDHCSSRYHPKDSDSTYNTSQFALKECRHETGQLCERETCTIICPKKVYGHSCRSLSSTNSDKVVCTNRHTSPSLSSVLTVCPLSMSCSQDNNQTCSHHLMHTLTEVKCTKCTEDKNEITVVKRERSPSAPLLSLIPSDLNKKSDERSLRHCTEEPKVELVRGKYPSNANFKKGSEKKSKTTQISQTTKKGSGIHLLDGNQFSDELKTIKSLERGVSVITTAVTENQQQFQGASERVKLNLEPELIDCHNNKQPQAPNTRSRRRQEVLTALGTPADDATNGRQTQIKEEPANMDQLYSRQKKAKLKQWKSIFKEYPSMANCKTVKNLGKNRSSCYKNAQLVLDQSNSLGKPRKSKRTIVPPPRFSSYVTEPRKMYFVACFSDSIFTQRSQADDIADEVITPPQSESHVDCLASQTTNVFSSKADCQGQATATATKESSPIQDHLDRLSKHHRSPQPEEVTTMPSTCRLSHDAYVEYTSPIKLMFVSPVKDEDGVKYSLKSAAAVNGTLSEEYFDPCEESSWSGTPEKNTSQGLQFATLKASPLKSSSSPAKQACVAPRSSPNKTALKKITSPEKSESTSKSGTSIPKTGLKRSSESTLTKCVPVDDNLGPPYDTPALHDTTPPKRRPGRPKKLGPQLEKKVKRPIGRPRKEKIMQPIVKDKSVNENTGSPDMEENVNKNLKITVLYGRSRRNKRMVSEGFDQLQTEFHDACQAVGLNNNWRMLMNNAKVNSTDLKTAPDELSQEIPLFKPVKVCAKSNIKCQSLDDVAPLRKPGRPAKVKISGISVTVTTVSPRQRKILINKDKTPPNEHNSKKELFQQSVCAKEPKTITHHSVSKSSDLEQQTEELKVERIIEPNPPVAIRHSERVRKPSIHFLHAVATSSSYSRSSALVRRSKQLLLNKSCCEQKKDESQNVLQTLGEQHLPGKEKGKRRSLGLHQISTVSVESIYSPKEMKWWSASIQAKTLNQELARRIRRLSDSWVSDTVDTEAGIDSAKNSSASGRKFKHSSVVRSLFDCSPNKPRSCSMQQLCSWFMQTTETQSLTIVKKASSRNSYELMHFPRSTKKKTICYSPQAERLRKHLKKFAKSVPKSPCDFKQAQRRIHGKYWHPATISAFTTHKMPKKRTKSLSTYRAILHRAKRRFFTKKERRWRMNNKTHHCLSKHATTQQLLPQLTEKHLPFCRKPLDPAYTTKDYLYSQHASQEKLKECSVFLRKINSLNSGLAGEEGNCSTNTLDDGSPSLLGKREKWAAVDQAVKTDQMKISKRTCLRHFETRSADLVQAQHVGPKRGRSHSDGVVAESIPPPPAKRLRQSRMMGLSGPRWRDFVFGN